MVPCADDGRDPSRVAAPTLSVPRFSVVVPTRGDGDKLQRLLLALQRQTLAKDEFEIVLAFDGAPVPPALQTAGTASQRAVALPERRGPGAARNAGVRASRGTWIAFTEDDCAPAPDWLEAAAARIAREPALEALEGATLLPDGKPARRRPEAGPTWLPTNLFVRRDLFERSGGYGEAFFDRARGIYFREDSDFGFTLAALSARVGIEPAARVIHPREHPTWIDPIRWARRYEMDPLLAARHPEAFREGIEVWRLGPVRIRRPFVRACGAYVLALVLAGAAALIGEGGVAAWFLVLAALAFLVVWAKWRLDPRKAPAALVVPFVLLTALARGKKRVYVAGARPDSTA
ncbi:MAG TPA: glycosyltransferase [Candidatus Omnitrophota bacterium]|nr:glycosyltransferase [Candidatus Omnitrophota bacterium]